MVQLVMTFAAFDLLFKIRGITGVKRDVVIAGSTVGPSYSRSEAGQCKHFIVCHASRNYLLQNF